MTKYTMRSITEKPSVYYDNNYVYVVNSQIEIKENVGSINEFIGYEVEVTKYEKDEYIRLLMEENTALSHKVLDVEDILLEMSMIVYG